MRGWLLDTNIVSELRKTKCNENVARFIGVQKPDSLYLSDVTFAEIRFGIDRLKKVVLRTELEGWVQNTLRPWFGNRVFSVDEDVLLKWRIMVEQGRKRGHTFSQPDLFIAAVASCHELVVVSRDTSEFIQANVPVFDPWSKIFYINGKEYFKDNITEDSLLDELYYLI